MAQFFTSDGQSIGVSASTSVLLMNFQDCFPLGWTLLISLQSKGLSSLLQHHSSKTSVKEANKYLLEAAEREGLWAPPQSARCLGQTLKSHLAAPILREVPAQLQVGNGLIEIHPASH